jgi:hypothetical protein
MILRRVRRVLHATLAAALLLVPAGVARATSYQLIEVNNDGLSGLRVNTPPVINDAGTIVFGASGGSIYASRNGAAPVLLAGGQFPAIASDAAGTVAYVNSSSTGVLTVNTAGGPPTTTPVAQNQSPASPGYLDVFNSFFPPAVSNAGKVALSANPTSGGGALYTNATGPLTQVAGPDSGLANFGIGRAPSINAAGTIAFVASTLTGSGPPAIYALAAGSPLGSPIAVGDGTQFDNVQNPVVNDAGAIAFEGDSGSISAIYTYSGGTPTQLLSIDQNSTSGLDAFENGSLNFNGLGQVAFAGEGNVALPFGHNGIFTGPSLSADKVIAAGDFLAGAQGLAQVIDVSFATGGFNDEGQIVFLADLTDGTTGLFLANPIPEPGSLGLLGLGGLGLLARRRRRA